ncbi:choice-of-anchor Q domain-containing protein [Tahibacter sp. UC22_41]|uniref:choice-of-anchor Q domain-containing protein n=1 Tax=Tahibacter sp. UC22_41 TaxID=3350178 RepID=UPI0036DEE908
MLLRLGFLAGCAFASLAQATTIAVTTTQDQFGEDNAACGLREALQAAVTDAAFGGCPAGSTLDTITLDSAYFSYALTRAGAGEDANATGDLDVSGDGVIIFQGQGAQLTTIDARGLDRVLDVAAGSAVQVFVLDLTLTGGDPGNGDGGAILMRGNTLIVRRSHLAGNAARNGGGLYASAAAQSVQFIESAATRNLARGIGGGVHSSGALKLVNATLSENLATSTGGGLSSAGTTSVKNATIAFNSAQSHAGAHFSAGSATVDNSLFVHNRKPTSIGDAGTDLHCAITVSSGGYNSYLSRNCTLTPVRASDRQEDPQLSALVDAGRGVPVHLLLPGSPAVDAGAPPPNDGSGSQCASTDQRGAARQTCDRGAFELRYTYAVTDTADAVDSNIGNGVCQSAGGGCTLRAALQEAAASDAPALIRLIDGVYELNIPGAGEDLGATGDLDIYGSGRAARVLIGGGADRVVIRSTTGDRVFDTPSTTIGVVPVGLFGMRISGGNETPAGSGVTGGGGMRLRPIGHTTLDQVWFDGNTTGGHGGGLFLIDSFSRATTRITRSAFTRNSAVDNGGGAYFGQGERLSVNASLFADNRSSGGSGGGVCFSNSDAAELAFSTITRNRSARQGGGFSGDGVALLSGVLMAGNSADLSHADCHVGTGLSVPSGGYNLVGQNTSPCPMSGDTTGNLVGVSAPLSVVAMAGRPLPYVGAQPGNPAVDSVPHYDCLVADGRFETQDLTGAARPGVYTAACTIGAVEGVSDLLFADGIGDGYVGE